MQSFTTLYGKGIWLSLILLLTVNHSVLKAEGTPSLAPDPADATALFIGAGDLGGLLGDYGQFAWVGSPSRLYFNMQNLNEKAYIGFSLPWNNREFVSPNPYTNTVGQTTNLEFRIVAPDGTHLTCFGNSSGWQSLNTGNISNRSEVVFGPQPIAGAGGYTPFVFDPSTCSGLSQTGDYYIEFRSTDPAYNPDDQNSGFYIEFFDITVADAANQAVTGRVWSNNWGLGIQADGDGPFDRAFNGAFYVCSAEGFVSKINFKNAYNNRAEAGKNNDQRSGFRAGNFNVSFNTTGPDNSGNVVADRQSRMNINAPNPELRVFLNPPSEELCEPAEVGEFAPANTLLSGCANDRCINMTATQPGLVEILIEQQQGANGTFDASSDRLLAYVVTANDLVTAPQTAGFVYEFCIPWDGKDGEGNFLADGNFKIAGSFSQGIYHFPVYDAEFNDDGFSVETINPPLGFQKVYYDDSAIQESNNITGESKNGTNGCVGACHKWTGEWETYFNANGNNTDDIYGNFNTINTWWFATTTTSDVTGSINNDTGLSILCPPNATICAGSSIEPSILGGASSPNDDCTVQIEFDDVTTSELGCNQTIERTWSAVVAGIPDATTCVQTITIEDFQGPTITGLNTTSIMVSCDAVPAAPTALTVTDNCDQTVSIDNISFTETRTDGTCANNYVLKREWKVSDACGNSRTYQQTITVEDATGPVISGVPADVTAVCGSLPAAPTNVTATDPCGGTTTIDFKEEVAGSCAIVRTWTATDACGNTSVATQTIVIDDTVKPDWVNFETSIITNCGETIPDTTPTAVDECGEVTITLVSETREEIEDCAEGYDLVRRWRAEDACGNRRTRNQTVKIRDNTKPEWVDFPKVECIECTATPPNEAPVAIDNCDNSVEIVLLRDSLAAGECANDYELFKFWQATDNCGNSRIKRQRITIKDTVKPEWDNFPNNIVADCNVIPDVAATTPSATDNCSANVSITLLSEEIEGSCDAEVHRVIRTWEAADECGNTRTKKQFIKLRDNTQPSWTDFPAAVTVSCDAIPAEAAPLATDNCTDNVSVTLVGTTRQDQTCDNTYTILREWQAADACGNVRTRNQYIYVRDQIKPTWVDFPAAQTLACGTDPAMIAPIAIDNCGGEVVVEMIEQTEELGACPGSFTMFRRWRATDACGNSITQRQRFNFRDNEKPEWTFFPANRTESCSTPPVSPPVGTPGTGPSGPTGASAAVSDVPTATDNCGNTVQVQLLETTRVEINEGCTGNYRLRHRWQATDACGNTITQTQVVTYRDNVDPVWVNFPETITVTCDAIPVATPPAATDLCSSVQVELLEETIEEGTCPITSRIVRRWRAFDDCGNSIAQNEVIRVRDRTAPTLVTVASPLSINCDATNAQAQFDAWIANNGGATATDNCGDLEWFSEFQKFTFDCGTTIPVTFVAIDQCGNQVETSTTVSVGDDEAPVWTTTPTSLDQVISCSGPAPTIVAPVATDNCSNPTISIASDVTTAATCAGTSYRTISWKAVDACGNESALFMATITTVDEIAPSLVGVPADAQYSCNSTIPVAPTVTATDNCDNGIVVTFEETEANVACDNAYTIIRTWSATDACGNTTIATQNIAISDDVAPTLVGVPANSTSSCGAVPAVANVTATDNCDGSVTVSFAETKTDGTTCAMGYSIQRVWTAVDACGNIAIETQTIEVSDDTPPTLVGVPTAAFASCTSVPARASVTVTDNCDPNVIVTFEERNVASSTCPNTYTLTRVWQATDACGNTTEQTQIIEVSDDVAPIITGVPANVVASCDAMPAIPTVTATDDCDADVTVQLSELRSGSSCSNETLTRTWTATDACGNSTSQSQVITIFDNIRPVLSGVPANAAITCGEDMPSVGQVTVSDNCASSLPIEFTEETIAGECAGSFTIRRTWSAVDLCGNMVSAQQTINVSDNVKPTWGEFNWNRTIQCATDAAATAPTATDNCGTVEVFMLEETTEPGDCATPTIIRRWRAEDACGNRRTRTQTIKFRDNQRPDWVDFPETVRLSCDEVPAPTAPQATDNCSGVTVTHVGDERENITCDGRYTLFRTWEATDACGNSRTTRQRFNVIDNTKPDWVAFPENITVECASLAAVVEPTFTDGCSEVTLTFLGEEKENIVCSGRYTLFRNWQIADACGNTRTRRQRVNVRNTTDPEWVNFPETITVDCDAIPALTAPSATGACDAVVQVNLLEETFEDGTCPIVQRIVRRWEAVDGCGNRIAKNEVIRVRDRTVPVLSTVASNLELDCSATNVEAALQAWIDNHGGATAADNCDDLTWFHECPKMDFNCGNTYTVSFTAIDGCGNQVTTNATVSFGDNTAPSLSGIPANIKVSCGSALPALPTVTATDNCDTDVAVTFEEETENSSCANSFTVIRTWTATDDCGNAIEEEQVISVVDDTPPTLVNVPTNTTIQCGGGSPIGATASTGVVTATDNCGGTVNVVETSAITGSTCAGNVITKTWTATDACGNTSSLSQTITIEDNTPPSIVCPPTVSVQGLGGCGASGRINIDLPVAQDNCDNNVLVTSSTDLNADFPAGTTTVQLTATDDCGNIANCSFNVVVSGGTSGFSSQPCPTDITISCDALAGQAIATWEPPSGDACCSACTGPTNVSGYTFLGERGGHRYYLSSTKVKWNQARNTAIGMGGYLAVINDPAENAFLAGLTQNQKVYIGLTDASSEGNFTWSNGEAAPYRNWALQQPNNKNNQQDVVQLLADGTWNDTYNTDKLPFLIEMDCINVTQSSGQLNGGSFPVGTTVVSYSMTDNCGKTETCSFNVTVEPSLEVHVDEDVTFECKPGQDGYRLGWAQPSASSCCDDCLPVGEHPAGYLYMGRIKGHHYYCSVGKANHTQAAAHAQALNGYLAVINTQEESDLLTSFLNGTSAYIGLSDKAQEGKYVWGNGDPLSFQNWATGQPNNQNGAQDYVQILPNGKWDDIFGNAQLEFIVEVPCIQVEQIGGPAPGSFFGPGVHTITYQATDNCGNTAENSFDITVNACTQQRPAVCTSKGGNDFYFWINKVQCGDINNTSGKNRGYGDFTNLSTTFKKGSSQKILLTPGFSSSAYPLFWRVFIDYNQDGDFNDPREMIVEYKHTNPIQATFQVPSSAKQGPTVMRVAMAYGRFFGGCQSFTYGEVEDYTVDISVGGSGRGGAGITGAAQSRSNAMVEVLEPAVQLPLGTTLEADFAAATPSINVYPNPVNRLLTIDLDQVTAENAKLRIFNSVGQQIHQQPLSTDTQQQVLLDVSDYKDGMYLITIEQGKQQPLLKKFTKF